MNRNGPGVENSEGQLSAVAWIDMKPRDIDEAAELGLCPDRNEGKGIGRYGDDFLGEQERELTGRDGERVPRSELAHRDRRRVGGLIIRRHIDFATDGQGIGGAIDPLGLERLDQWRQSLA